MTGWFRRPEILAELSLDRHAVIEASAGTGKTYTLEHLVVDLLLTGDSPATIQEILVVTFTERATYELHRRVRRIIERIAGGDWPEEDRAEPEDPHAWHIDETARARLEAALLAFDHAPILTIHGFCQRVLTEHAFLTGRPLEGDLVDGRHAFGRAFRHVLRREIATAPWQRELLQLWLDRERSHTVDSLEDLLFKGLTKPGEKRPEFDAVMLERDLTSLAELLADGSLLESLERAAQDACLPAGRVKKFRRTCGRLAETARKFRADGVVAALGAAQGDDNFAYIATMQSNRSVKTSRYPDDYPELAPLLLLLPRLDRSVAPLEAAVFQSFAPPILAELQHRKAADGLYDYDDMIEQVRLAASKDELVTALRRQYRHALIDEFQDTDAGQWQIFQRIFFAPRAHDEPRGCLRVIGDPKQAIYSFRGADLWVYRGARESIVDGPGRPHYLVDNYRSTPRFLEAVNLLLGTKPEPTLFTGANTYDVPVRCGRERLTLVDTAGEPLKPVCVLEHADAGQELDVDGMKRELAEAYAAEMAQILSDSSALRIGEGEELERVRASDVFVLTRTTAEGHQIGERLRAAGVPFAFYKEEGLFESDEAHFLLDVLNAIADPAPRAHLFKAWNSPFFDLPLAHLHEHRRELDSSPAMAQILEWKAMADRRDYDRLFASLPVASGLSERLLFRGNERSLTNVLHLLELLEEQTIGGNLTMPEVVAWLSGLTLGTRRPGDIDADVQRLESDGESVQIMTMHKAKGLEAAIVFVYGGIRAPAGHGGFSDRFRVYHDEDGERVLHVGELSKTLKDRANREENEEEERLLYVTLTRARGRVYLPYCATEGKNGKLQVRGSYRAMNRRLHALAASGQLEAPLFERRELVAGGANGRGGGADEDGEGADHPAAELTAWSPRRVLLQAPARAEERAGLRWSRAGLQVTSYSHMKRMLAAAGESNTPAASIEAGTLADDHKAEIKPPAGDPEADTSLPRGSSYGIFVHELLEHLDFATVQAALDLDEWRADDQARNELRQRARLHAIDERHLDYTARILFDTLTSPIWLGDDLIIESLAACDQNIRELEFLYPIPEAGHPTLAELAAGPGSSRALTVDRGYVKGFIDHVFVHRGRTYVLDWKSDLLRSYAPADLVEQVRTHYHWQETLYSLALCKMLGLHDWQAAEERFGGVLYVFLRGMPGRVDDLERIHGGTPGVYFQRPSWEKLLDLEVQVRDFHA